MADTVRKHKQNNFVGFVQKDTGNTWDSAGNFNPGPVMAGDNYPAYKTSTTEDIFTPAGKTDTTKTDVTIPTAKTDTATKTDVTIPTAKTTNQKTADDITFGEMSQDMLLAVPAGLNNAAAKINRLPTIIESQNQSYNANLLKDLKGESGEVAQIYAQQMLDPEGILTTNKNSITKDQKAYQAKAAEKMDEAVNTKPLWDTSWSDSVINDLGTLTTSDNVFDQAVGYVGQLGVSIGQMGASVAAAALAGTVSGGSAALPTLASMVTLGANVYNNSATSTYEELVAQNYDKGEAANIATKKATTDALIEMGTEVLVGGTQPFTKGVLDPVYDSVANALGKAMPLGTASGSGLAKLYGAANAISSSMKSPAGKFMWELAGEGAEEWVSEFITPYIDRNVVGLDTPNSTSDERALAFLGGVLTSGFIKGAHTAISGGKIYAANKAYLSQGLEGGKEGVKLQLVDDGDEVKLEFVRNTNYTAEDAMKAGWVDTTSGEMTDAQKQALQYAQDYISDKKAKGYSTAQAEDAYADSLQNVYEMLRQDGVSDAEAMELSREAVDLASKGVEVNMPGKATTSTYTPQTEEAKEVVADAKATMDAHPEYTETQKSTLTEVAMLKAFLIDGIGDSNGQLVVGDTVIDVRLPMEAWDNDMIQWTPNLTHEQIGAWIDEKLVPMVEKYQTQLSESTSKSHTQDEFAEHYFSKAYDELTPDEQTVVQQMYDSEDNRVLQQAGPAAATQTQRNNISKADKYLSKVGLRAMAMTVSQQEANPNKAAITDGKNIRINPKYANSRAAIAVCIAHELVHAAQLNSTLPVLHNFVTGLAKSCGIDIAEFENIVKSTEDYSNLTPDEITAEVDARFLGYVLGSDSALQSIAALDTNSAQELADFIDNSTEVGATDSFSRSAKQVSATIKSILDGTYNVKQADIVDRKADMGIEESEVHDVDAPPTSPDTPVMSETFEVPSDNPVIDSHEYKLDLVHNEIHVEEKAGVVVPAETAEVMEAAGAEHNMDTGEYVLKGEAAEKFIADNNIQTEGLKPDPVANLQTAANEAKTPLKRSNTCVCTPVMEIKAPAATGLDALNGLTVYYDYTRMRLVISRNGKMTAPQQLALKILLGIKGPDTYAAKEIGLDSKPERKGSFFRYVIKGSQAQVAWSMLGFPSLVSAEVLNSCQTREYQEASEQKPMLTPKQRKLAKIVEKMHLNFYPEITHEFAPVPGGYMRVASRPTENGTFVQSLELFTKNNKPLSDEAYKQAKALGFYWGGKNAEGNYSYLRDMDLGFYEAARARNWDFFKSKTNTGAEARAKASQAIEDSITWHDAAPIIDRDGNVLNLFKMGVVPLQGANGLNESDASIIPNQADLGIIVLAPNDAYYDLKTDRKTKTRLFRQANVGKGEDNKLWSTDMRKCPVEALQDMHGWRWTYFDSNVWANQGGPTMTAQELIDEFASNTKGDMSDVFFNAAKEMSKQQVLITPPDQSGPWPGFLYADGTIRYADNGDEAQSGSMYLTNRGNEYSVYDRSVAKGFKALDKLAGDGFFYAWAYDENKNLVSTKYKKSDYLNVVTNQNKDMSKNLGPVVAVSMDAEGQNLTFVTEDTDVFVGTPGFDDIRVEYWTNKEKGEFRTVSLGQAAEKDYFAVQVPKNGKLSNKNYRIDKDSTVKRVFNSRTGKTILDEDMSSDKALGWRADVEVKFSNIKDPIGYPYLGTLEDFMLGTPEGEPYFRTSPISGSVDTITAGGTVIYNRLKGGWQKTDITDVYMKNIVGDTTFNPDYAMFEAERATALEFDPNRADKEDTIESEAVVGKITRDQKMATAKDFKLTIGGDAHADLVSRIKSNRQNAALEAELGSVPGEDEGGMNIAEIFREKKDYTKNAKRMATESTVQYTPARYANPMGVPELKNFRVRYNYLSKTIEILPGEQGITSFTSEATIDFLNKYNFTRSSDKTRLVAKYHPETWSALGLDPINVKFNEDAIQVILGENVQGIRDGHILFRVRQDVRGKSQIRRLSIQDLIKGKKKFSNEDIYKAYMNLVLKGTLAIDADGGYAGKLGLVDVSGSVESKASLTPEELAEYAKAHNIVPEKIINKGVNDYYKTRAKVEKALKNAETDEEKAKFQGLLDQIEDTRQKKIEAIEAEQKKSFEEKAKAEHNNLKQKQYEDARQYKRNEISELTKQNAKDTKSIEELKAYISTHQFVNEDLGPAPKGIDYAAEIKKLEADIESRKKRIAQLTEDLSKTNWRYSPTNRAAKLYDKKAAAKVANSKVGQVKKSAEQIRKEEAIAARIEAVRVKQLNATQAANPYANVSVSVGSSESTNTKAPEQAPVKENFSYLDAEGNEINPEVTDQAIERISKDTDGNEVKPEVLEQLLDNYGGKNSDGRLVVFENSNAETTDGYLTLTPSTSSTESAQKVYVDSKMPLFATGNVTKVIPGEGMDILRTMISVINGKPATQKQADTFLKAAANYYATKENNISQDQINRYRQSNNIGPEVTDAELTKKINNLYNSVLNPSNIIAGITGGRNFGVLELVEEMAKMYRRELYADWMKNGAKLDDVIIKTAFELGYDSIQYYDRTIVANADQLIEATPSEMAFAAKGSDWSNFDKYLKKDEQKTEQQAEPERKSADHNKHFGVLTPEDYAVNQTFERMIQNDSPSPELVDSMIAMHNEGVISGVLNDMQTGGLHSVKHDKDVIAEARAWVGKFNGDMDHAFTSWKDNVYGEVNENSQIKSLALMEELAAKQSTEQDPVRSLILARMYSEVAGNFFAITTTAAQVTRGAKMINAMFQTPGGTYNYAQQWLNKLNTKLNNKSNWKNQLTIPADIAAQLQDADIDTRYEGLKALADYAALKTPRSTMEKINDFRNTSMLCAPTTHIRNTAGNVISTTLVLLKDLAAGGLEDIAANKSKLKDYVEDRRFSIKESFKSTASEKIQANWDDMNAFAKMRSHSDYVIQLAEAYGNKYLETFASNKAKTEFTLDTEYQRARTEQKTAMSRGVSQALENEDLFGVAGLPLIGKVIKTEYGGWIYNYEFAFKQMARANGWTTEFFEASTDRNNKNYTAACKALAECDKFAVSEANDATFHTSSKLAKLINQAKDINVASDVILNAIIPFVKTPINIAKSALRYSPLAFAASIVETADALNNGKTKTGSNGETYTYDSTYTLNEAIDRAASGMTGSALFLLGMILSSMGILNGAGSDDEKEEAYAEQKGFQPWSVNVFGLGTYTLDWGTPASITLFSGVQAMETLKNASENGDAEVSINDIVAAYTDAALGLLDPMMEMSFMSSFSTLAENMAYNGTAKGIAKTIAENWTGQLISTAFGKLEKAINPTMQSTLSPKDSDWVGGQEVERVIRKNANKLPGVADAVNADAYDVFGEKETYDIVGNDTSTVGGKALNIAGNLAYQMLSPGYWQSTKTTPEEDLIDEVYSYSHNADVIPDDQATNFTVDGSKFYYTNAEYSAATSASGAAYKTALEDVANSDLYDNISESAKEKVLSSLVDYADYVAHDTLMQSRGIPYATNEKGVIKNTGKKELNKVQVAVDSGLSVGEYYIIKAAVADMDSSDKKSYMRSIGLSSAQQKLF